MLSVNMVLLMRTYLKIKCCVCFYLDGHICTHVKQVHFTEVAVLRSHVFDSSSISFYTVMLDFFFFSA